MPPDPERDADRWIQKAESDLRTASHTLTLTEDCPYGSVCFHAQQGAEKYLKALLVARGVRFPKTHDSVLLAKLTPGPRRLELAVSDLELLSRYSFEGRYPGDWEPFDRAEAQRALVLAQREKEQVLRALKDV